MRKEWKNPNKIPVPCLGLDSCFEPDFKIGILKNLLKKIYSLHSLSKHIIKPATNLHLKQTCMNLGHVNLGNLGKLNKNSWKVWKQSMLCKVLYSSVWIHSLKTNISGPKHSANKSSCSLLNSPKLLRKTDISKHKNPLSFSAFWF